MKKIIFAALALVAFNRNSSAQLALGLEVGPAFDTDSEITYTGGALKLELAPTEKLTRMGVSIGYYAHESDLEMYNEFFELMDGYQYADLYPINFSYQLDLSKGQLRPFIGIDAGITYVESGVYFSSDFSDYNFDDSYTLFGIGATLGARYAVSEKLELTVSGRPTYNTGDIEFPLFMLNFGGTIRF